MSTNPTTPDEFDAPSLARGRTTDSATGELRGECPRWVLNVLDAVSFAQDKTRTALVNEILSSFAKGKLHEASLIHRLAGLNPTEPDAAGK